MIEPVRYSRKDPEQFFRTIRTRVNDYFSEKGIRKTGNWRMYLKTAAMFAMYFVPYGLLLSGLIPGWACILLYLVMGVGIAGIGLAIMHDANHGSYSRFSWVNNLLSYSMNVIGGSSFTWKIQHNVLHHTYTNIYELDEDIHDKPFLRLSPHGKLRKYHRFQYIYAVLLYSAATLSWVLSKDFVQLVRYYRNGMMKKNGFRMSRETAIMISTKLLYVFYIIVIPLLLGVPWWAVLVGFLVMHMFAGVFITTIFQLAHVVEGPKHFAPPQTGTMENTWAIHQLHTTANFSRRNPLITWFVGGLNFQIEHHLFPNICHIHYRKISEIVKKTAEECGIPYYEHKRFHQAVISHLKTLKYLGNAQPQAA